MHINRCGNNCRKQCHTKGKRKEAKIQEFMCKDTMDVEPVMYAYTSNNWCHWTSNIVTEG